MPSSSGGVRSIEQLPSQAKYVQLCRTPKPLGHRSVPEFGMAPYGPSITDRSSTLAGVGAQRKARSAVRAGEHKLEQGSGCSSRRSRAAPSWTQLIQSVGAEPLLHDWDSLISDIEEERWRIFVSHPSKPGPEPEVTIDEAPGGGQAVTLETEPSFRRMKVCPRCQSQNTVSRFGRSFERRRHTRPYGPRPIARSVPASAPEDKGAIHHGCRATMGGHRGPSRGYCNQTGRGVPENMQWRFEFSRRVCIWQITRRRTA